VGEGEPKAAGEAVPPGGAGSRPSHLASLGLGLALGLLGALPALAPGCDEFALLCWIACLAPAAGAFLGARGVDPLRFGAVAPATWAAALALLAAARTEPGVPLPALGAAAWTGLFFAGFALGRLTGAAAPCAALLLATCALLVGLPARGGLAGAPWPPRAASALLDASPFVLLGECSGVRDMAWHRSLYAAAGTDRFQRDPWSPPATSAGLLAVGLAAALLADRGKRRAARRESA
jgi:hypothetical protein